MSDIATKLSYLADTKDLFKDRLNSLGAEITSSTTFRNYLNWLDTFYNEVSNKTDISQNGVVGRTSQESTRGINVYNVNNHYVLSDGYSINDEDWITNTYDNSQGIEHYENIWCRATSLLETSTNYLIVCEIKSVSGSGILYPYTKHSTSAIDTQHSSYSFSSLSPGQKILIPVTTKSSFSGLSCDLRTLVRYNEGNSGSITFRLSLLTDTSITSDTFVYEPFTNGSSPNPDYPQPINNLTGNVSYKITTQNGEQTFTIPLGDIELCDIDTYEDKIYSSDGRFYLYKNIKKHLFTTSDVIQKGRSSTDGYARCGWGSSSEIATSDFDKILVKCNKFLGMSQNNNNASLTGEHWYCSLSNTDNYKIMFRCGDTEYTGDTFPEFIKNNEIIVYYPLKEPTTTEITQENYPSLYNALKQIQDYLTTYKINKEFILGYSSPEIEY